MAFLWIFFEHQIHALLLFDIELMEVCKCVSNNENEKFIEFIKHSST